MREVGSATGSDLEPQTSVNEEVRVVPIDRFPPYESFAARRYWSTLDMTNYESPRDWSMWIAKLFASLNVASVFEFGCGAGRNLLAISNRCPNANLVGVDINKDGVRRARNQGLDVREGGEEILSLWMERHFDACLTVSVMDHLPDPEPVLVALARVSNRFLVMLEPWVGKTGKVTMNRTGSERVVVPTTPYSYSWDLARMARNLLSEWEVFSSPCVIHSNLGPYYKLVVLARSDEVGADAHRTLADSVSSWCHDSGPLKGN